MKYFSEDCSADNQAEGEHTIRAKSKDPSDLSRKSSGITRVLVVDDDPDIQDLVSVVLETEGYECTAVSNGVKALEKQNKGKFDLIILDYMMPEMDGSQVCETLRKRGDHTPILFLSAAKDMEKRVSGFHPGAILKKPFDISELLTTVSHLAESH